MYENSPENFKKFQKRFKYTICDTEPNPQDSGIENYAYGFHPPSVDITGCAFGSSHWHLIFENTSSEDNIIFSPYAPAATPCLVTCFKFLILPTEKNFVTHGAIISRLHIAVECCQNLIMFQPTKLKNNFLCLTLRKDSQPLLLPLLTNVLPLSPM